MIIAALMITFTAAAQQTTVEGSRFFDNTYVGVNVGGQVGMSDFTGHQNWTVSPMSGVYLGKWLTPTFGVELNGDVLFHDGFNSRNTFVDATYLGVDARLNLNNVFHKYRGVSDRIEVMPFVGFGWLHSYGDGINMSQHGNTPTKAFSRNILATKMGVDLGFNLGNDRAWAINVRPNVMYALSSKKIGYSHYNKNLGRVGVEVGFTYRFGHKNSVGEKTHNFTKTYTVAEYNAMVDELSARENTVYVTNEVEVIKEVIKEVKVKMPVYLITQPYFNCAKYDIDPTADVILDNLVAQMNSNDKSYTITGYASLEGAEQFNTTLSENRAKAVYDALVDRGIDATRLIVVAGGATDKFGDSYESNRTVMIVENN